MSPTPIVPAGSPFTLQNIPFGVISTDSNPEPRCASAIGDHAIDLIILFEDLPAADVDSNTPASQKSFQGIFSQPTLNAFAELPSSIRTHVRNVIATSLSQDSVPQAAFIPLDKVTMHLPMKIGGYSDFFCSLEHCQNCAPMTGGIIADNFFHAPSVYNGRVSSIVPSPRPVRRPKGVFYGADDGKPVFGPSRKLDFELEMGFFVSNPVPFEETMDIKSAREHVFGFVLLNDWSSRDLQGFEMKPLGPFHSKGFGTSISPWVVTLDALDPFACRPKHDHDSNTLEHLKWPDRSTGTFDIRLSASLVRNGKEYRTTKSNLRYMYWSPYQQLAHHAAAGCGLSSGDLLGTGTISGEDKGELGCLFEATLDGTKPIKFDDGCELQYLLDDDEIVLEAWCGGDDASSAKIGFGECRGKLLPTLPLSK